MTGSRDEHDDPDSVGRIVTAVNPRIVPAGSRSPASSAPPQPGRPRKAVLAGVGAVALVGITTGALMLYGGGGAKERAGSDVTPGPERNGGQDNGSSASPTPTESSSDGRKGKDREKDQGARSNSHSRPPGGGDGGKVRPPRKGDGQAPPAPGREPGGSAGTVRIWNHNSDQCINVPGGDGSDGTPLQIRTCSAGGSQQWKFASDGTVRALGLCMDVANASSANGTVIQLADCSGNPAQQFRLSEGSDLVNPQADKCVAVRDGNIRSGTPLQLWDCSGEDSQKWSPA